ncbi:MAG: M15 family metallopeptidase [Cyclobacteriaceae bacterium]
MTRIERIDKARESKMKESGIIPEGCPLITDRLREVYFKHYNLSGEIVNGSVVVFDTIAPAVENIFLQLYELRFEIDKAFPILKYQGSDLDSMNDNNSSGFNGRKVLGTDKWSSHAYGMAIDINPFQNPYLTNVNSAIKIYPENSFAYLNREVLKPGMITKEVVEVFRRNHFSEWGGYWNDHRIDYHHFQIPWDTIHKIEELSISEGLQYLENSKQ